MLATALICLTPDEAVATAWVLLGVAFYAVYITAAHVMHRRRSGE